MSIPKHPRQQMINLMYLVLTALLALNVSSEVLNSFRVIKQGIEATNRAVDSKNSSLMTDFEFKLDNDSLKTFPYINDANRTRKIVGEFYGFVESLKAQLIDESGGLEDGKLVGKKDVDVPTRIMVDQGYGDKLETMIMGLKSDLLHLPTLDTTQINDLTSSLALTTDYDVKEAEKLGKRSWATYNFERVPVIAAITLLTKIQGDARASEAQVLEKLYNKVDIDTYKFDDLSAKVIAPDNYILTNEEEYEADIFFAATSRTQEVEVFIGEFKPDLNIRNPKTGELEEQVFEFPLKDDYIKLDTKNGIARYSELPSQPGDRKKEGVIKIRKPDGYGFNYFPFELHYKSAQPSAIVSPDKLNVMYVGVDNPISVSVPGFSSDRVRAYLEGGRLKGSNGKYIATVDNVGHSKVVVTAALDDGSIATMGEVEFRAKPVPDPIAVVRGQSGGPIKAHKFRICKSLDAIIRDFEFEVNYRVVNYRLTYQPHDKKGDLFEDHASSSEFTKKMLRWVKNAEPGDKFYFEFIKAKGPEGWTRDIPGITFTII